MNVGGEPGKRKKVKCVFSYDPEQEDELKLEVGDILEITKQVTPWLLVTWECSVS